MPCVDRELGYAGLKSYAWLPNGTPFLVVLFSIEHARLEAVIEADYLGQLRTAAASAVAATTPRARTGATTLGVFGCGRQAASHVAALRDGAAVARARRRLTAATPRRRRGVLRASTAARRPAIREVGACDVVVTVTTSHEPVLHGDWLRDGATRLAVGANDPSLRELDDAVLERAALRLLRLASSRRSSRPAT